MMLGREDVIMRAEWWFRAQALEPSLQSHIRGPRLAGCVTLGKLLALSVPQFLISIMRLVIIAYSSL